VLHRRSNCPLVLYLLYSAAYTYQTHDQNRFIISEVAVDWHELMIPQRTMRPSIANWTGGAARRHATAPISLEPV